MRYLNIIPLIGGMTIGNMMATGKKPEAIISYSAFDKNDSHIVKYLKDVPYYVIDNMDSDSINELKEKYHGIDFVSGVPPCAGLSLLNSANRSADAPQNEWMLKASEFILNNIKPKVFWCENAPGLYSDLNISFVNKLKEIGNKFNYTLSIYKTDTKYHGIPQLRPRTFFFFWKSNGVPKLNYYKRETPLFKDWMTPDKNEGPYKDVYITRKFPYEVSKEYIYLKEVFHNNNYIDLYNYCEANSIKTTCGYLQKGIPNTSTIEAYENYIKWLDENGGDEKLSLGGNGERTFKTKAEYYLSKFKQNKGVFDISPIFSYDYSSAMIGKNIHRQLHPKEERFISVQEGMKLMGLPEDFTFSMDISKAWPHICQNVPTCTARDMTYEVIKFINNELEIISSNFVKQNNLTEKIDYIEKTSVPLF